MEKREISLNPYSNGIYSMSNYGKNISTSVSWS